MTAETSPAQTDLNLSALEETEEVTFLPPAKEIPPEIVAFVDHGYKAWQENPAKWRRTRDLGTEKAARTIARLAREHAKSTSRTFRTKTTSDATRIVYKVTDAVASPNGSEAPSETSSETPKGKK